MSDSESVCPGDETDSQADKVFLEEVYSKRSLVKDELRIVLIGTAGSGKNSIGNIITGKDTFVCKQSGSSITEICHNAKLERFGRPLQVVDTPGLFDTNVDHEHMHKEIKNSVLMTSPGIHAVILVTKHGQFTEEEQKTVEYFRKVFGDGMVEYLMIIFTGKDGLDEEESTIETYLRTAPQPIQHFLHESRNRYKAVNNQAPKDEKDGFAQQLIFNIDEMVKSNGGKCYTTEMFRKAETRVKKREEEERKRKDEESFLEEVYSKRSLVQDELRMVLIGKTGSGKSSTGNTITGKNTFVCKQSASSVTEICQDVILQRCGRHIQVVDTPGLFDTNVDNEHIYKEIKKCVLMTSPGIHAVILVINLGRYTDEEKQSVEYFRNVFGDGMVEYLMIIFTGKDDLDEEDSTIETYLRTAPQPLLQLVGDAGNRYMALNNRAPKDEKDKFVQQLISNIDDMVKSNGGKCYTTKMFKRAEAMVKEREEEERKKKEEEKRKEREAIENNLKEKYDAEMKEQANKMQNIQENLVLAQEKAKEQQRKQEVSMRRLQVQMQAAENEKRQREIDMRKREEEMRKEAQRKEKMNAEMMARMMKNIEESNRRHEQEMKRMKDAEDERRREQIEEAERAKKEAEQARKEAEAERAKKAAEQRKLRRMPYVTSLDGGLYPGREIYFRGTPYSTCNPSRFVFNLVNGCLDGDDIGFHFSARFNEGSDRNQTVRNSRINGNWKNEERWQPNFPFTPQVSCSIRLVVTDSCIRVFVDGKPFVHFPHRMPISKMNFLHIKGNISLEKVDTNYLNNIPSCTTM